MADTPLPSSFDGNTGFYEESRIQKLRRRLFEEPLIPLGCLLTCWALLGATKSIRAGDHHTANRMFRRRIYAQGFTIVAMVAGSIYWDGDRKKRKEFEGAVQDRKNQEKHQAWLRELEARDEEEKEFRARVEKGRQIEAERKASALTETRSVVEDGEGCRDGTIVAAVRELWQGRS
ncbi:Respiratory supercomplex factor 1, mitochondrial [Cryomyces minteri]|uniref:Respiratory supercomplex factor 1, mitochondrial n=1 Tax=Cryomyces minteri TaxID=331657 RepID=A0A4U0X9V1_9PEZI|nr:Respiratory supercomplex factor 1, mitochondrial [Cryomyces minteri]